MFQEDEHITPTDKGKGKEREESDSSDNHWNSSEQEAIMYPPVNEDAEETRRVEENLRRWEVAERQRRKAARESLSHSAPSLVSDFSRRASLLFSGRRGKQNSISILNHAALQSQDNVPLTQATRHTSPTESQLEHESSDPFTNSSPQTAISPFDDVFAAQVSTAPPSAALITPTKDTVRTRHPPSPPRPLNLPPPRSPPPIFPLDEEERDNSPAPGVRWWHDWLCGCGEGPDRGGDIQAGHTNPLE